MKLQVLLTVKEAASYDRIEISSHKIKEEEKYHGM
jgi:hypothetical protein